MRISDYVHSNGMNYGKTITAQSSSFGTSISGSSISSASSTSWKINDKNYNHSIKV